MKLFLDILAFTILSAAFGVLVLGIIYQLLTEGLPFVLAMICAMIAILILSWALARLEEKYK